MHKRKVDYGHYGYIKVPLKRAFYSNAYKSDITQDLCDSETSAIMLSSLDLPLSATNLMRIIHNSDKCLSK